MFPRRKSRFSGGVEGETLGRSEIGTLKRLAFLVDEDAHNPEPLFRVPFTQQ